MSYTPILILFLFSLASSQNIDTLVTSVNETTRESTTSQTTLLDTTLDFTSIETTFTTLLIANSTLFNLTTNLSTNLVTNGSSNLTPSLSTNLTAITTTALSTLVTELSTNFVSNSTSSVRLKNSAKVKAHGSLMVIAWVFLSSNAVIIARYYDFIFKRFEIFRANFSTNVHRSFMALVVVLSLAAFFVIFAELNGKWVSSTKGVNLAHSIVGIVAIVMSLFQAVSGVTKIFIKPKKPAKFLRYVHRIIGIFCFVLATVNLYFGFFITDLESKSVGWGIMIGWVFWLIFFFSVIEILEVIYKIKDDHDRFIDENKEKQEISLFVKHVDMKEKNLKFIGTILLVVHLIISASITTALLFYINSS
ncbi:ferric-chelate reductase 1 isoform X1 [Brachionus plicatilis]|uniref:ascorbate ferrireductase (transmembrane) n=1 Tax=Brachionus plicatilis TaxID=10195 RepID=A0A3M7SN30_BRAPC|nr:ferric-chelate reductase 1 isoform X1 [Brachionus plicatilis]